MYSLAKQGDNNLARNSYPLLGAGIKEARQSHKTKRCHMNYETRKLLCLNMS